MRAQGFEKVHIRDIEPSLEDVFVELTEQSAAQATAAEADAAAAP